MIRSRLTRPSAPIVPALFLAMSAFLFVTTDARGQHLPDRLDRLDAWVAAGMRDWKVPGVAIAIVHDDRVVLARGYGVRTLGHSDPVDADTLFAVASNTKAFTAALLGLAVDSGSMQWDDRVSDHLPHFQMHDPYVTRDIRIRDLLCHRSGLHTFGGDHLWIGSSYDRDDVLRRIRHLEPISPFRARYNYQNLMFLVAGETLPAATGTSWDDHFRQSILKPLGMKRSCLDLETLRQRDNVASAHEEIDGKVTVVPYDDIDAVAPAASLNSSVREMAQWMRVHLADGMLGDQRILPATVVREMQKVHMPLAPSEFDRTVLGTHFAGYGLGWGMSDYRGRKLVAHGGGLTGMISRQTLVPELGLGIFVLSNYAPNSFPRALSLMILDAFLEAPETDWNAEYIGRRERGAERRRTAEQALQAARHTDTKPSLALADYAGAYANPLSGSAAVRITDGKLVFDYNPRHCGTLEHWHHDTFRVNWDNPIFDMPASAFVSFVLDEHGKVEKLRTSFYRPIEFRRVP